MNLSMTELGRKRSQKDSKIIGFDPECITIPNDVSNHKYVLRAAVIYEAGENLGNETKQGHYRCWKKVNNGWLNI